MDIIRPSYIPIWFFYFVERGVKHHKPPGVFIKFEDKNKLNNYYVSSLYSYHTWKCKLCMPLVSMPEQEALCMSNIVKH